MSKFKDVVVPTPRFAVGQKVVCVDNAHSHLSLLATYTVSEIRHEDWMDEPEYRVGDVCSWLESRFEDFDTWASHQRPVDDKTELEQCKIQIAALQANKAGMTKREEALVVALKQIAGYYCECGNAPSTIARKVLKELFPNEH